MEGETKNIEREYKLFSSGKAKEFLDTGEYNQICLPIMGKPLKLLRIPYFKNFPKSSYGDYKK